MAGNIRVAGRDPIGESASRLLPGSVVGQLFHETGDRRQQAAGVVAIPYDPAIGIDRLVNAPQAVGEGDGCPVFGAAVHLGNAFDDGLAVSPRIEAVELRAGQVFDPAECTPQIAHRRVFRAGAVVVIRDIRRTFETQGVSTVEVVLGEYAVYSIVGVVDLLAPGIYRT